jgi:hypothetical protein
LAPNISRHAKTYNESPVFGLAGIILPETAIRPFATKFLQLKERLFRSEINKSGVLSSLWEKKGIEIFTAKKVVRYPHFRSTGFRLINSVRDCGGSLFYYGREKITGDNANLDSIGLYTTVLGHTIRQLEAYGKTFDENFIMVVDQHSARKQLLVTASKTMFGHTPARHMLSPPFEVRATSAKTCKRQTGYPLLSADCGRTNFARTNFRTTLNCTNTFGNECIRSQHTVPYFHAKHQSCHSDAEDCWGLPTWQ